MRVIKIAIVAQALREGGGLVIMLNLLRAINRVAQAERLFLFCSTGYGYEDVALPPGSDRYLYRGSHTPLNRYLLESFVLPRTVKSWRPDVVFCPANTGLVSPGVPQALFVHQPALVYDNKKHFLVRPIQRRLRAAWQESQVKRSLPATQLIFVQTPVVQKRFAEAFKYPEERIRVLRFPVPAEMKPAARVPLPPVLANDSEGFHFLMMTRYLHHRNPDVVVALCRRFGNVFRERKIRFITTITPQDDPLAVRFLRRIGQYGLGDVILNVGRLDREEVSQYLTHCQVMWLHTLMETLCLPFLEAMTLGTPVMAPDLDFVRYVCGDAVASYDPWQLESIFEVVMQLRESAAMRKDLIEKGRRQMEDRSRFVSDWDDVASDVLENLRRICC